MDAADIDHVHGRYNAMGGDAQSTPSFECRVAFHKRHACIFIIFETGKIVGKEKTGRQVACSILMYAGGAFLGDTSTPQ